MFFGGVFSDRSSAGVVTQVKNFNDTQSGSGAGTFVHSGTAGLSDSFNPFDSSLGTLDSFSIAWVVALNANGSADAGGGTVQVQMGGSFYVDTNSYSGGGGGDNTGSGPFGTFRTVTAVVTNTQSFLVSNAGVSYNPAILASVTGGTPFQLSYGSGSNVITTSYSGTSSVTAVMTGSATLTYNYTAAPVPEPSSMLIGGSLFAGVAGMRRLRKRA
jgi:hypothetical protein